MARQPRIPMKSEIEQALLVLEHTERSTLLDCGADIRLKQLFQTTSSRRKAEDFDKSGSSPAKLAKLSQNQVRSPLLRAEFCTDSVATPPKLLRYMENRHFLMKHVREESRSEVGGGPRYHNTLFGVVTLLQVLSPTYYLRVKPRSQEVVAHIGGKPALFVQCRARPAPLGCPAPTGLGFGIYRSGRVESQLLALRKAAHMVPNCAHRG